MNSILYGYISKNRRALLYAALCLCLSFLLTYFARNNPDFSQWYSEALTPIFVNTLGRLFSVFHFSVFEFMVYITILSILFVIISCAYLLLKNTSHLRRCISVFFAPMLCIITSLLLVFTLTASINYSKPHISFGADTSIREYSTGELFALSLLLVDKVAVLSADIPIDEEGLLLLDRVDLNRTAADAMSNLKDRYPTLSGYYPSPKPVFFSKAMSYLGISGIFSPFTLEANYNRDIASFMIPYTICHELAHLKGFMREDEANFLAYLACRDSQSPQFQYSGTLNALLYTLNALYSNVDRDSYDSVYLTIPEQVRAEISYSREYWKQHTTALTSLAKKTNDKYLMANAQMEGTKSYGKIVDLLLKEYDYRIMPEYGDRIPQYLLDNIGPSELN